MPSRISVALAIALLTACGSSRSAGRSAADVGTYRFIEHLNDARPPMVIEGTVTVTADTVTIEMPQAACVGIRSTGSPDFLQYRCGDVLLNIDRRDPSRQTHYVVPAVVRVPVRTCIQYGKTPSGEERCLRYSTVYEERRTTKSGRLQLRRQ